MTSVRKGVYTSYTFFFSPVTDHASSDDVDVNIPGKQDNNSWHHHKGAGINAIRCQSFIKEADIVMARFGDRYRQWNVALVAGYAVALFKSINTLHDPELPHALKELDRAANAVIKNWNR